MNRLSEPVIIDSRIFRRNERSFWICFGFMWLAILALIFVCVWGFSLRMKSREKKIETRAVVSPDFLRRSEYIKHNNPNLNENQINLIIGESERCSEVADISADLFLVLVKRESGFDPFAISPKFALGLTQVNSNDWPDATFDIQGSMRAGCRKLIYYLTESRGGLKKCLSLYNGTKRKPSDGFARMVLDDYVKLGRGDFGGK